MPGKAGHRALRLLRTTAIVAVLALAALTLRDRLPSLAEVGTALRTADPRWLVVAVVAELVSLAMYGRQQRRLLTAFGLRLSRGRALALAYSRSAMAIGLPAGSAISAAYAFRQFRASGASRHTSGTVLALSALFSAGALALLYAAGALLTVSSLLTGSWTEATIVLGLVVVLGLLVAGVGWRQPTGPVDQRPARPGRHPVLAAVRAARAVAPRHWALALGAALTNWLADLLCLYAAARAFHLPLELVALGAVYLTVQVARQLPLTPGGIGVVELGLLAGLVAAGAGVGAAAATVLVYRLLSCWLVIPAGAVSWLGLRRPPRSADELAEDRPDALPPAGPCRRRPDTPAAPGGRRRGAPRGPRGETPRPVTTAATNPARRSAAVRAEVPRPGSPRQPQIS